MTPTIRRCEYIGASLNGDTKVIDTRERDGNVGIELGWGLTILGNRKEDFINLKAAAQRAIDIFDPPVTSP